MTLTLIGARIDQRWAFDVDIEKGMAWWEMMTFVFIPSTAGAVTTAAKGSETSHHCHRCPICQPPCISFSEQNRWEAVCNLESVYFPNSCSNQYPTVIIWLQLSFDSFQKQIDWLTHCWLAAQSICPMIPHAARHQAWLGITRISILQALNPQGPV